MRGKLVAITTLVILVAFSFILGHESSGTDSQTQTNTTSTQAPSPYELWEFVNSERVNENVPPLRLVEALNQSARRRCNELSAKPSKTTPYSRVIEATYGAQTISTENIDTASESAVETVSSWVALKGSARKSILDKNYTDAGYAVCANTKTHGYLAVQHLAGK